MNAAEVPRRTHCVNDGRPCECIVGSVAEAHCLTSREERESAAGLFDYSPSGASKTCRNCGTVYDLHGVDLTDLIPPVGDGCALCDPWEDDDE